MSDPILCQYQSQIYQCWEKTATEALIVYPGYTAPGWVNVALNGPPSLIPAMAWVPLGKVYFYKDDVRSQPLPAIPFSRELQVGSRVRWNSSFAEWAIVAIEGDIAKIRQTSGYASTVVFEAPIAELRPQYIGEAEALEKAS